MQKRVCTLFGVSLLATVLTVAQANRTIEVNVVYTGAGKVDANHKIYVALWNSPNLEGPPAAVEPLASKSGMVTFKNVNVPAYVTTAYDPSGRWDAQTPPPTGASLGMYSTKIPTPDPINVEPGKTAKIKLSFDDSNKKP